MSTLLFSVVTQSLTFLPLALGISISYTILRATDMTLDGSFVLGAAVFARFSTLGMPPIFAAGCALIAGMLSGIMVSLIQRGGKVDPLLAGILATFILASLNLLIMGMPNINLLSQTTLFSNAFNNSEFSGWMLVGFSSLVLCGISLFLISSRLGLLLHALGDNPGLLHRLGKNIEIYRMMGFALTNALAAASGCITAQTVGYADIGMGLGMTLTGIGAIILGQQLIRLVIKKSAHRTFIEFSACLIGVLFYFFAMNCLLRFEVNPIYLKMILGLVLILFLRAAVTRKPA
ncbi:MAG TPA: ABC transporter permease [Gammaproteobacteria bacterium]|nr:ABC transporter permease [Gammaproteobacteria bacterium]